MPATATKSTVVTKVGNLTADPELQFTPSGKAVCHVNLAVNNYNPETKKTSPPVFYALTIWEQMGENVAQSLTKGMRVVVQGRTSISEWKTKEGETRQTKEINVTAIGPDLRFATCEVAKVVRREVEESDDEEEEEEPF